MIGTVLIRADASVAIGSGHVMRCLALAQAWQDAGGQAVFVMSGPSPIIRERLHVEKVQIEGLKAEAGTAQDARETSELACKYAATWTVVDGYQFGADYQRMLHDAGCKVLFLDDNGHAESYCADFVLNQNLHACEDFYRDRAPKTHLMLGPRYALLRREFMAWRNWKREVPFIGRKVLVTMGGSDPDNVTLKVMEALNDVKIAHMEVMVVVGGNNPHAKSLEIAVGGASSAVRLTRNATNMPELMAWADIAIAGAGSTCWEMCLMGLPAVLIELADNQHQIAQQLACLGIAAHVGRGQEVGTHAITAEVQRLLDSEICRNQFSQRSGDLVDGNGCARVLAFLAQEVSLRKAVPSDCRLVYEWASEPGTRAASFHSAPIPWEEHNAWFNAKMTDPNAMIYIAMGPDRQPIGQVRYQIEGERATLSIGLGPEFRGKRLGFATLMLATEEFLRNFPVIAIDAYAKPENEASARLFARAGFRREGPVIVCGQAANHFTLERNAIR